MHVLNITINCSFHLLRSKAVVFPIPSSHTQHTYFDFKTEGHTCIFQNTFFQDDSNFCWRQFLNNKEHNHDMFHSSCPSSKAIQVARNINIGSLNQYKHTIIPALEGSFPLPKVYVYVRVEITSQLRKELVDNQRVGSAYLIKHLSSPNSEAL